MAGSDKWKIIPASWNFVLFYHFSLSFYARISRYLFYYFCKYFSGVKKGGVEVGQKGGGDTNAGPHSAGGQEDGPAERRAGQVRSALTRWASVRSR